MERKKKTYNLMRNDNQSILVVRYLLTLLLPLILNDKSIKVRGQSHSFLLASSSL